MWCVLYTLMHTSPFWLAGLYMLSSPTWLVVATVDNRSLSGQPRKLSWEKVGTWKCWIQCDNSIHCQAHSLRAQKKRFRDKLPLSFNITFLLYLLNSCKDLCTHPWVYLTEYSSQPFDFSSHEDQMLMQKPTPVLSQLVTSEP